MGGLLRTSSESEPRKPSINPVHISEEEDPVPFYLLDESAGIEPSSPTMGTGFSVIPSFSTTATKRKMQQLTSAMKKSSSSESNKLKKLVRFLDRVEVVPAPLHHSFTYDEHEPLPASQKKQKLSNDEDEDSFYAIRVSEADPDDPDFDIGIASGLGRAGSPNRSPPNRSPNPSSRDLPNSSHLSVPRLEIYSPPSPPPSWRIPPESLIGRRPHVQEPPRVKSPANADEEIDLRADEYEHGRDSGYLEDLEEEKIVRPGVSYVRATSPPKQQFHPPPIYPVIARKMWPDGEIRFEDQWGRRLIPVGHKDSFRFDLWPVEEDAELEGMAAGGPVRGAWVRGRATVGSIPLH